MHYFNKIDKNGINKQYYYFGVADAFMLKGDIQGALNIFNEGINNNCYECYGGVLCYYIKTGNKECFLNVMNRLHSLNAFIPTIYLAYEYVYTNNDEKFSLLSTSNYSALQIFKYSSDRAVEHILEYSDSKLLGNDRMVKTFVEKSSEILDGIKPIDTLDIVDFYDISFACLPETTYRVSTLPNDKSKVLTVYILNHPSGSFSEKRSLVRKRI